MYKLIYSEEELKKYFDLVMKPLISTEVFFVSLSARNKYLTEEERRELLLGRTEMFERKLVRYYDWNRFLRTIRKFETNEGSYTTKNNSNIPQKCIVCYININPSDTLKAYKEFNEEMNKYMYEISSNSIKGHDIDNIINRIKKMDHLLETCYQKSVGTKYWVDVDFDIPKEHFSLVQLFQKELNENNVKSIVIETKSGFHVLLDKSTINYNFTKTIIDINEVASRQLEDFEIVLNKNSMIPLPGTIQAGHEVKILD